MTKFYKFPCGCRFEILDESTPFPLLNIPTKLEDFPKNCRSVYELLNNGDTLGVFQLETRLGRNWTKRLKPENIEHLAAEGAILRPGVLNQVDDKNVSMTEHYCLRKNFQEENSYKYEALKDILKDTYGVLVYQEQAIEIAKQIAGFNLVEADILRRGIGKKDSKLLSELCEKFINGCVSVGKVTKEQAKEIFEMIREGERYSFNKSHSVGYAHISYYTAYAKIHGPLQFFTAKLRGARNKIDSTQNIVELIYNAKLYNIDIKLPDIRKRNYMFDTDLKNIYFGITDIKGIGEASFKKINESIENTEKNINKKIDNWSYYDFLVYCFMPNLTLSETLPMINSGCFDWLEQTRTKIGHDIKLLEQINKNEAVGLINISKEKNITNINELIRVAAKPKKDGGVCSNKNRVEILQSILQLLENPIINMKDDPLWVSFVEEDLLGVSITSNKIDSYDITNRNTTCKELICGKDEPFMVLGVDIKEVITHKIKRGDNEGKDKGLITVSDGTNIAQIIAWPETWEKHKNILLEKNSVIMQVVRGQKKYSDSIILKNVYLAS